MAITISRRPIASALLSRRLGACSHESRRTIRFCASSRGRYRAANSGQAPIPAAQVRALSRRPIVFLSFCYAAARKTLDFVCHRPRAFSSRRLWRRPMERPHRMFAPYRGALSFSYRSTMQRHVKLAFFPRAAYGGAGGALWSGRHGAPRISNVSFT